MPDFTLNKYKELCLAYLQKGYRPLTVSKYLDDQGHDSEKKIIVRHDIDRRLHHALRMGALEKELNIRATYYFRYPSTFNLNIMQSIHDYGHEIGYHYEVLSKSRGNYEYAMEMFKRELGAFRKHFEITTICMHGSPLSRYDNRDLWNHYDYKDFGIKGEAYLSINQEISYFSDTGRTWNGNNNVRDHLPGNRSSRLCFHSTDNLIQFIKDENDPAIYLVVHPERWAVNNLEYPYLYCNDMLANIAKKAAGVLQK